MTPLEKLRLQERITREELDAATNEQKNTILRLERDLAKAEKRASDLQRMWDHSQRHIDRLQAKIDSLEGRDSEALFRE